MESDRSKACQEMDYCDFLSRRSFPTSHALMKPGRRLCSRRCGHHGFKRIRVCLGFVDSYISEPGRGTSLRGYKVGEGKYLIAPSWHHHLRSYHESPGLGLQLRLIANCVPHSLFISLVCYLFHYFPAMQCVVFKGPLQVALEERPRPQIQDPTDVVLKVRYTALCGRQVNNRVGTDHILIFPWQ